MQKWIRVVCSLTATLAFNTHACTDFKLTAQDKSVLVARSMEFATDLKSNLRSSVRGRQYAEVMADGKTGLSWKAQYGYVFLDGLGIDAAIDGMNETGLSFEYLYLPGETLYPTVPAGKNNQALSYLHFGDWVLSNFKSVDDVKKALANVSIFAEPLPGMPNMIFPLHASIYDATGKGIVVEFVDGKVNVFDNEVGMLTNSPTFEWQITNLRNYVNLSPWVPNPVSVGGMIFSATGQGSGMKGLPGDVSPPSRFVKMSVLKASAYPAATIQQALNLAQHMINNVDIPVGTVRARSGNAVSSDFTQWVVFKDLTHKVFYYRTYQDTTLHAVALTQLDLTEKAQRLSMSITDDQYVVDMTKQFSGSRAMAQPTLSA